jgi:hypothetical protein
METPDYWDISFLDAIDPAILATMKEFETPTPPTI